MKTCIIFNPAARGEKSRRFKQHLESLSSHCALRPTAGPGQGHALAARAVEEGFETIVAAGGDGTVNEVLNGMADDPQGLQGCRLAVLPLGTVNVFAREIGIPTGFDAAWTVIRAGRESRVDLAEAEFASEGAPCRRLFVQMAGAGVDSRAIELVSWERKKRLGQLAYLLAGLSAMASPKHPIVVRTAHGTRTGEQIFLGNGRLYGGPFRLFPQANMRDGLLEVTILPRASWGAVLRGGWGLLRHRLYQPGIVEHLRADSVSLSSASPVSFQVEGEYAGHLPAKFSIRPLALRLVVPFLF